MKVRWYSQNLEGILDSKPKEEAKEILNDVERITDMGEILFSYGDFLENNRNLEPSSFSEDWWKHLAKREGVPEELMHPPTVAAAFRLAREFMIPLHPKYNLFWHDLTQAEILYLMKTVKESTSEGTFPMIRRRDDLVEILIKLGYEFVISDSHIRLLNEDIISETFRIHDNITLPEETDPLKLIGIISGIEIKAKAPTRIGARMGRPEKAGDRKMKPKVHMLFPLENLGEARRLLSNALKNSSGSYEAEFLARRCSGCNSEVPVPTCPYCGSHTEETDTKKRSVDIKSLLDSALKKLSIDPDKMPPVKGVKKLISRRRVAEPLEKVF
ncbi:DNA polymerase II, large subunit DP2 [mine drainage metagenome]|uniref:DNA polymerase II, large subunit DP2 n=1 Tax=mine drainage metagenome TaxID=410659 RepID=T0YIX8_9ZZZZ